MDRKQLLDPDKLAKFVDDYAEDHPHEFDDFSKQMEENMKNSCHREDDISKLPKEDIVWLISEQKPEVVEGVKKRTLVMGDRKGAYLAVHMEDAKLVNLAEQAYSLLCLACLYPLSGKSRRPRLVTFKDAELARTTQLDLSKLKIKYINPESVNTAIEDDEEMYNIKECCSCRTRGTLELFKKCSACNGFYYCSVKCQKKDWKKKGKFAFYCHKLWCPKIKDYKDKTDELSKFPFTYVSETTSSDFHLHNFKLFLERCGVYNSGLWRRECPLELPDAANFGQLTSDDNPYILPVESSVLNAKPTKPAPTVQEPIKDWEEYYTWREFKMDSPIAILLNYPLTLYYIITSNFSQDYPEIWSEIESTGKMKIHILGVEKEVEMLMVFKEFGCLLPTIQFDIHMFGLEFMNSLDGKKEKYGNVSMTLHHKLFHDYKGGNPHAVVGFNAGIGAYVTWGDTITKLKNEDIPAYFTDYCQYSCECSRIAIKSVSVFAGPTLINPFRNPVRKICTENTMPWYSNGFIIKLDYTDVNEKSE